MARKRLIEARICQTCGGNFGTKPSNPKIYCSKKCMYERNSADFSRICEHCGKSFRIRSKTERTRTCSLECGYAIRRVANKKDKIAFVCKLCGSQFHDDESKVGRRVYCSKVCRDTDPERKTFYRRKILGDKNPAWKGGVCRTVVSKAGRVYARQSDMAEWLKLRKRKMYKLQATPKWANGRKIRSIYAMSKERTKMTGVQHNVDHIVPLIHLLVCGLHNEFNLQILTEQDNRKKHNRTWPNMPE